MTTALYRRYRPDAFTDVIGQEHVTEPLMQALRADRVTHAYLFSGPRGCGKTTSARILARCLNCAEGPTDTPCGRCESCVELATGGPGSLDVVEIDAASHGGVDDARDLRERATFAPARDRFKIFILDEAHMVTSQGFNALLKIVEEPPPHIKFIFATTEPDKVIGTIRSRTHHYPFRLVPPDVLQPYLEKLCAAEQVPVGAGVLPLVVRAGGGSVRDSLSVLDQLVAGADESGLDYERAVALLGYTHAALLDDTVEAIAARDGASAFRVIDRVISSGHEPRRFVEDLLERLRDLIVIAASGEAARAVLRDLPADQLARMQAQAATLGPAELSRSADLVNEALTEMTGATSPRLHLELLAARLLLPAVDDGARGLGARVERLEREVAGGVSRPSAQAPASVPATTMPVATQPAATTPVATTPVATQPVATTATTPVAAASSQAASSSGAPAASEEDAPPAPGHTHAPAPSGPSDAGTSTPSGAPSGTTPSRGDTSPVSTTPVEPTGPASPASVPEPPTPAEPVPPAASASGEQVEPAGASSTPSSGATAERAPAPPVTGVAAPTPTAAPASAAPTRGGMDAETVRRRWPEVLQTLRGLRMATWVLVSQNAQVGELAEDRLALAFTTPQLATTFRQGSHAEHVQRALHETLGLQVRIEPTLGAAAESAAGAAATPVAQPAASRADESRDEPPTPQPPAMAAAAPRPAPSRPVVDGVVSAEDAEASWGAAPSQRSGSAPAGPSPESSGARDSHRTGHSSAARPGAPGPGSPVDRAAQERPSVPPGATGRAPDPSDGIPDAPEPPSSDEEPDAGPPWDVPGAASARAQGHAARATAGAEPAGERGGQGAGRPGGRPSAGMRRPSASPRSTPSRSGVDDGEDASPDDPDLVASGLVGAPLVAQMLGGTVIDEIPED